MGLIEKGYSRAQNQLHGQFWQGDFNMFSFDENLLWECSFHWNAVLELDRSKTSFDTWNFSFYNGDVFDDTILTKLMTNIWIFYISIQRS